MMGTEMFEACTHTVRVQDGSGGPAGLKQRSESSEPGRDCMERSTIGPPCFFGAQSWFAKNTACRSLAPPRQAAGRVVVSCSWSVPRSHLFLWLRGLALSVAESCRCRRVWSASAPCWACPKRSEPSSWPPGEGDVAGSAQGCQHCDGNAGEARGSLLHLCLHVLQVCCCLWELKGFFWPAGTQN